MRRVAVRWIPSVCALAAALALVSCGGGSGSDASTAAVGAVPDTPSGSGNNTGGTVSVVPPTPSTTPALGGGLSKANIFYSGHSLLSDNLPERTAAVADSLSTPLLWNRQIGLGSPVRLRTRGENANDANFGGYRTGQNRDGSGMDVINELRNPQTIAGQRYDTLIITERNDLGSTLQFEDTVRYVRHFHERFMEGNPQGKSYFSHSWLGIADKANPSAWIAYERAAAPAWQCVAARINVSLAAEGRSDRMHFLPAGLALATLIERATQGNVDGISAGSTAATVNQIFNDDVHFDTVLGSYYMGLVNYASVFRRSPVGAAAPAGVTAAQAKSLQETAWNVVANYYANEALPDMASCRALMRGSYCGKFYTYIGRPEVAGGCGDFFSQTTRANPFYFEAANDQAYWFTSPR
jgi:hypothetical protein